MARGSTFSGPRPHYLRIAGGKIVETVDASTPGAVARLNKNQITVHERIDDFVDGMIVKVLPRRERDKIGGQPGEKQYSTAIVLSDDGELYQLEIDQDSRNWSHLCQRVYNIDTSKCVRFAPYDFTPKASAENPNPSRLRGLNILQRINEAGGWNKENVKKLDFKWTQENPGNLPAVKEIKIKDKTHYDDSERAAYWNDMLARWAVHIEKEMAVTMPMPVSTAAPAGIDDEEAPRHEELPPSASGYGRQTSAQAPAAQAPTQETEEDDLPF